MIAGCSIRLSTPPRLSASAKISAPLEEALAAASPPSAPPRPCRRSRASGAGRARAADGSAGRDSRRARSPDGVSSQPAMASAFVAVTLHAERQRLQAAQREEAVERTLRRRRPRSAGTRAARASSGCSPTIANAADHVGVAVQILGRRMHDDVEAELERPLHVGAGEGVVGDRDDAAPAGDRRRSPRDRRGGAADWSASRPRSSGSRAGSRLRAAPRRSGRRS